MRPTATGLETFTQIRDASSPEDFSWKIEGPDDQELKLRDDGAVGVVSPSAGAGDDDPTDGVVATISAPTAVDANGTPVRASLNVDGDSVTMHVEHKEANVEYPVVADPFFTVVSGSGPWATFGSAYALADSHSVVIQGVGTDDGGCRFVDSIENSSDGDLESRELAVKPSTCQFLMERGIPPSSAVTPDGGPDGESARAPDIDPAATAASASIRA